MNMPNHVANSLKLEGYPKIIQEIFEKIKNDEEGLGSIDFNKIIPMPSELNITEGSETFKSIDLYLTSINPYMDHFGINKLKSNKFNDLLKKLNSERIYSMYKGELCEREIDKLGNQSEIDKLMEIGKKAINNFINYGATTWYH